MAGNEVKGGHPQYHDPIPLTLSVQDAQTLVNALDAPTKENERLKAAVNAYHNFSDLLGKLNLSRDTVNEQSTLRDEW